MAEKDKEDKEEKEQFWLSDEDRQQRIHQNEEATKAAQGSAVALNNDTCDFTNDPAIVALQKNANRPLEKMANTAFNSLASLVKSEPAGAASTDNNSEVEMKDMSQLNSGSKHKHQI